MAARAQPCGGVTAPPGGAPPAAADGGNGGAGAAPEGAGQPLGDSARGSRWGTRPGAAPEGAGPGPPRQQR